MTVEELAMSVTLPKLHEFAETMKVDVHDHQQLKDVFAVVGNHLSEAMDAERIYFLNDVDKGMFFALLAVIVDYYIDGRLRNAFTPATVN
jgi:hypothetical protein